LTDSTSTIETLRGYFLTQARHCHDLDSPFMVRLCMLFSRHLKQDSTFTERLLALPHPDNFWGVALPLRVAGALHALVLTQQCDMLAKVYPPHHDDVSDEELWDAIMHAIQVHEDFFVPYLGNAPQTNEVRRSGILLPGFLVIAKKTGLPFTLSELGASAGINLCWDEFAYRLGDITWGKQHSNITLAPQWLGKPPPDALPISVSSRAACDLSPINFLDPDEKLKLLSYIWADQHDRFTRTDHALDILTEKKYKVDCADISQWLPARLAQDTTGTVHVIYHTIAWNYQSDDEKQRNRRVIEAAGAKATHHAPLAWLRFEADDEDPGAALTLTLWPDGSEHTLGRADYHGRWIDWAGLEGEGDKPKQ
jgi:hypothetical protein